MRFVGGQIVHDDGFAWHQCRRQNLFDVGQERIAIHRAIQQHRRGQPVDTQPSDKSRGHPMTVRHAGHATLPLWHASTQPRHLGGGAGFINEDKLGRIEIELLLKPSFACGGYIGPLLLGRMRRLFLSVMRRRSKKRHSVPIPTSAPRAVSFAFSSAKVMSDLAAYSARIKPA